MTLAVLSGSNTSLVIVLSLQLSVRFDAVIVSSEVGYEKPDAKIFEAALGMYI